MDIRAALQSDASAIATICNQGIVKHSLAFEATLRSAEDMPERIKAAAGFPVLVAVDADGIVLGWAGLRAYRARFSVYFDSARGRGAGKQLLNGLIETAAMLSYWKLLSRAFPFNKASRALCRACGSRSRHLRETREARRPLARRGELSKA